MPPDGWEEWSKFILKELTRLSNAYENLNDKTDKRLRNLEGEIAMLKVKSGVWGILGGSILVGIFLLSRLLGA